MCPWYNCSQKLSKLAKSKDGSIISKKQDKRVMTNRVKSGSSTQEKRYLPGYSTLAPAIFFILLINISFTDDNEFYRECSKPSKWYKQSTVLQLQKLKVNVVPFLHHTWSIRERVPRRNHNWTTTHRTVKPHKVKERKGNVRHGNNHIKRSYHLKKIMT